MVKYFILLLIFHLLGDFYLQTDNMAANKRCLNKDMFIHAGTYIIPYLFMAFCGIPARAMLLQIIILSSTHSAIDCIFCKLKPKFPLKQLPLFIYDQALHIVVLAMISIKFSIQIYLPLKQLVFLFVILLLFKPSGILVNLLFLWIFGADRPKETNRDKIGCRIGYFERFIIFLLCIFNSISTIGFILAAKTLVRYEDIGENKNKFREKYLIGTLASSILALVCFGLLKYV